MKLFSYKKRKNSSTDIKKTVYRAKQKNVELANQSVWYALTIIIYLGCILLGFGVAYFILKVLIRMNIH